MCVLENEIEGIIIYNIILRACDGVMCVCV